MEIKNKLIVTGVIAVTVCVMCLFAMVFMNQIIGEPSVTVYASEISIDAQDEIVIPTSDVTATMVNEPIKVDLKVRGVSGNKSLNGVFSISGYESNVCCVIKDINAPYIVIEHGNDVYAINGKTEAETTQLLSDIKNAK